jgi:F-type H+-transporting ATPase subunit b
MEATLQALGGLLIKAVPTFLLVILLYFYLKWAFFSPLARVLEQRRQATEGARQKAEELLARAAAKTAEYEEALRAARSRMYLEQEAARQQWRQQHLEAVRAAREDARRLVEEARRQLEAELEIARRELELSSRALAGRIATNLLRGRAA